MSLLGGPPVQKSPGGSVLYAQPPSAGSPSFLQQKMQHTGGLAELLAKVSRSPLQARAPKPAPAVPPSEPVTAAPDPPAARQKVKSAKAGSKIREDPERKVQPEERIKESPITKQAAVRQGRAESDLVQQHAAERCSQV